MLNFPPSPGAQAAQRGRRALRRALWLGVFWLALPLNVQASQQSAARSDEAHAWLGRSCTVQGCAAPRSSAGIPLGFAGAVVMAGLVARRRGGKAPR